MKFTKIFYYLGLKTARHPITISLIITIFVLILLSGLIFLDFETAPQKLWVSQTSKTNHQQIFFGKQFGQYYRINQMILRKKGDQEDLWQKEYVDKIFKLQQKIVNSQVEVIHKNWTVDDLCYKPISGKGCMITSPTNFWKEDYDKFLKDENIKIVSQCLQSMGEDTMPCFDNLGVPVQLDAIFGQQGCMDGVPVDDCSVCNKTAKAMSVTFLLNNDFFTNKVAEIWEKDVLQKYILEFNKQEEEAGSGLYLNYMLERSVTDELVLESQQNATVIILSYVVMFIYIAIMMGSFPSIIHSRILVGLGGIFVVALSTLSSFSITSLLGIKQSLISAEVVPFLVLAIGVDNMFIITGARDRLAHYLMEQKKIGNEINLKDEEQIALALEEVGPSITTAAVSEFLSFLVGYLTDIPALESFCLCAAFAVLLNYILQITLFVAFVALDDLRIKKRRYDIIPCMTIKGDQPINHSEGKLKLQTWLSTTYYDFIRKLYVMIPCLIIYAGMTVVGFIGLFFFPLGLDQKTTVTKDGDLYNYFEAQASFVDIGSPAYIIVYDIDYNDKNNLKLIDEMSDYLASLKTVQPPVYSWYKDFTKFMYQSYYAHCNPNKDELMKQPLSNQIREFLKIKATSSCCMKDGLCGEPYVPDIAFNEQGEIVASRFRFYHVPLVNNSVFVNSVIETNSVANKFKNNFTLSSPNKTRENNFKINGEPVTIDTAFSYSLFYVYYDQYLFIRAIAVQNLLIGFGVIFVAVQFATNILASALVVLFVLSSVIHLIGLLYLVNFTSKNGIDLNAISVVNIVVAMGLSVEFSVHTVIFYIKSDKQTKIDKVRYAIHNVGYNVLIGILITKLIGVCVLLFAPSIVFRVYYFRMYIFLILTGFFHGFIILPYFLTYVDISGKKVKKQKIILDEVNMLPSNMQIKEQSIMTDSKTN